MNAAEMERAIQVIYAAEKLYSAAAGGWDDCRNELRGPASPAEIEGCERFIGRPFSPSYRQFLSLHNGWVGCFSGGHLLGTRDYETDEATRSAFAIALYTHTLYAQAPDDPPSADTREGLYLPERFYRFIDSPLDANTERTAGVAAAKQLFENFDEASAGRLLHARHTLIGLERRYLLVLDGNTLRDDGEMDVVKWSDGDEERWPTFAVMVGESADDWELHRVEHEATNPIELNIEEVAA